MLLGKKWLKGEMTRLTLPPLNGISLQTDDIFDERHWVKNTIAIELENNLLNGYFVRLTGSKVIV